jgi:hypothetical protein
LETLTDIFSPFKFTSHDLDRLSSEAKAMAIGFGKNGITKELPTETWDLFDEVSDKVWNSDMTNLKKITLGFQLYELFPSYYHFLTPFYHGIRDKQIAEQNEKEIIWNHFMKYLASENCYSHPVSYVLWVDFFEDDTTVRETWQGLVNNNSDRTSLLRLLAVAGPVPFELKESLFNSFLTEIETHELIFDSLLTSAYEVFGKIDKKKSLAILAKLQIDTKTEKYKLLQEKLK